MPINCRLNFKAATTRSICLCIIAILSACSGSPHDKYIDTLLTKLDKVHASIVKYRRNPSGVTEVSGNGINGRRSNAVDVALKTKDFFDSLKLINYTTFRDIQEMKGYEAWATEANRKVKEKADTCLTLVREIKAEYKKNMDNPKYREMLVLNNVPDRVYPVLWLTKDDNLVFALGAGDGVPVELILRVDFRTTLDSIRNQGK